MHITLNKTWSQSLVINCITTSSCVCILLALQSKMQFTTLVFSSTTHFFKHLPEAPFYYKNETLLIFQTPIYLFYTHTSKKWGLLCIFARYCFKINLCRRPRKRSSIFKNHSRAVFGWVSSMWGNPVLLEDARCPCFGAITIAGWYSEFLVICHRDGDRCLRNGLVIIIQPVFAFVIGSSRLFLLYESLIFGVKWSVTSSWAGLQHWD